MTDLHNPQSRHAVLTVRILHHLNVLSRNVLNRLCLNIYLMKALAATSDPSDWGVNQTLETLSNINIVR